MTLWSNEKLLNMVEQIVGPDIIGHPVWNLRVKTPKNDATVVPWHQGRKQVALRLSLIMYQFRCSVLLREVIRPHDRHCMDSFPRYKR